VIAANTYFDLIICVALIFTAVVTPYEVALLETKWNIRFGINCFVDLLYVSDLFRQFFLEYEDERTHIMVRDRKNIAVHYLKGWFIIDFVSILPFDLVALVAKSETLSKAKALKVIRLLRLLKLVRIVKALRLVKKYRASVSLSFNKIFMVKTMVYIGFFTHLFACIWLLTATVECDDSCLLELPEEDRAGSSWVANLSGGTLLKPYDKYCAGLYWAAMTITRYAS
jgi:potassium voltage-gated channel Eag-related subfamily H protein 7